MKQRDDDVKTITMKDQAAALMVSVFIIAKGIEPILRKSGTAGKRYWDWMAALGWLFIPVFSAVCFPSQPQWPSVIWWVFMALVLVAHQIRGAALRKQGYETHTMDSGRSELPGAKAKTAWEPLLVITCGIVMCMIDPCVQPLGVLWLLQGICLALAAGFKESAAESEADAMRDARLQQEALMSRIQKDR